MSCRMIALNSNTCAACGEAIHSGDRITVAKGKQGAIVKHAHCDHWNPPKNPKRRGKSTSVATWSANIK